MKSPFPRSDRTTRRQFLVRGAAALASGALATRRVAVASDAPTAEASLPTIALGSHRVTRLVVGSNPIAGYSYLGREADQQMREYFTPERTAAFLQDCIRAGINTHQYSTAAEADGAYRLVGQGGPRLQMLALLSSREDIRSAIESAGPIAAAHHGGVTDGSSARERAARSTISSRPSTMRGLPRASASGRSGEPDPASVFLGTDINTDCDDVRESRADWYDLAMRKRESPRCGGGKRDRRSTIACQSRSRSRRTPRRTLTSFLPAAPGESS
jgi:hypothetical protein